MLIGKVNYKSIFVFTFVQLAERSLVVDVNLNIRSMGPISEMDMVSILANESMNESMNERSNERANERASERANELLNY